MRWLSALVAIAALPFGTFAAKSSSSSADRFETFHAQAVSSSPLKLSDANYKKLTSAPRDYSVAVLLTALDAKYGCQLCGMFQPEWDILAKSWTKGDKSGESRLILSTLDFSDGRDTFMSVSIPPGNRLRGRRMYMNMYMKMYVADHAKPPSMIARPANGPSASALPAYHRASCCSQSRSNSIRLHKRVCI